MLFRSQFPGQGQQGAHAAQGQQFLGQGQQSQQNQQLVQGQQFPSQGQQSQQNQQLVQGQQFPGQGQQSQQNQQLVQGQQFPNQGKLVEQSFHGQLYGQEQLQGQVQLSGAQQTGQGLVLVQGQKPIQGQVQGCVQEQFSGQGKFASGQFHVTGMSVPQAEMGAGHGILVQNTGNLQRGLSGGAGMEENPSLGQPQARGFFVNQWQGEEQTGNGGIQAQVEHSTNQNNQSGVFGVKPGSGGNQGIGVVGVVSPLEGGK